MKSKTELIDIQRKIEKIMLRHVGGANAIKSAEIAKILGNYFEDATHQGTRQAIRDCLETSRLPIASNTNGYFLISNDEEFDTYMVNLSMRITGIRCRMGMVQKAWNKVKADRSIYSQTQICLDEVAEL